MGHVAPIKLTELDWIVSTVHYKLKQKAVAKNHAFVQCSTLLMAILGTDTLCYVATLGIA